MILQKNMVIKISCILFIILTFTGCDNTDYQVLKVDNESGMLEVLNANYIIDSIAFESNDRTAFSISLKNKAKGINKLNLLNPTDDYKIYVDNMDFKDCKGAEGIAYIRKKGFTRNITNNIEQQKKYYQEVQQFWFSYRPCQDSIVKVDALRRLK